MASSRTLSSLTAALTGPARACPSAPFSPIVTYRPGPSERRALSFAGLVPGRLISPGEIT